MIDVILYKSIKFNYLQIIIKLKRKIFKLIATIKNWKINCMIVTQVKKHIN